ncbi:MAG: PAS domain S-box protein [Desulfobacteraceae bacterium]|nr:PAS domain S-box protein [Desulfobacteraceae bacterium]
MAEKFTYQELKRRVQELESDLEYSREMLQVYEKASLGYQSLDDNGHYIAVNQIWLDTLGYRKEEVIGKSFAEFIHPDWRDHFKENFPRFKSIGEILGAEFQMVKKNRDMIQVSLTGKISRDKKGVFQQTHCIFHDITERKLTEDALRNSEEKHRRLFETMPHGVVYHAADETIISANPAAERILGLTFDQMRDRLSMDPRWGIIKEDGTEVSGLDYPSMISMRTGETFGPAIRGVFHPEKNAHVWVSITAIPLFMPGETKPFQVYTTFEDVTDRKQAEIELKESERFLQILLESIPLPVFYKDIEGRYKGFNKAFETFFGRPKSELINCSVFDINPPELARRYHAKDSELLKKLSTQIYESQVKNAYGEMRDVVFHKATLTNTSGAITGLVGAIMDITERKQAEEALKASEAWLGETMRIARVGGWKIDLLGNTLEWTDETFRLHELPTGAPPNVAEAIQFYHAEDRTRVSAAVQNAVVKGKGFDLEARIITAKENLRWVRSIGHASFHEGSIALVWGTIQDITERKEAEQLLRKSEIRVRSKLDAVLCPEGDIGNLDLVDIIDKARIQHLMDDFYQLTNIGGAIVTLDGNVVASTEWREICVQFHRKHPAALENCIESDTKLTENIEPGQIKKYRCKNNMWDVAIPIFVGDKHFGNLFIGQFFYEDENIDYDTFRFQAHKFGFNEKTYMDALDRVPRFSRNAVEIAMNYYSRLVEIISTLSYSNLKLARTLEEHKRNQCEREKLQAQLTQAQKMESVGSLAGGIAHDFNNLLFPIVGLSEMMLADFLPDSPEHQNLHEIFLAGKRGRELVQQILSFSRQSEQQLIPVHIQKILKEVFKLCRAAIPTDIPISRDIQTDCGPVMADPTQIHQIAMNLITNAYHAVEPVGGTILIQLTETDVNQADDSVGDLVPGRYAMLSVSDTGTGIDPAVIDKIFDPYFTTKDKGRGTGLGLATVYGIVKTYGGEISVLSDIGKGTVFHVYLPLLEKSQESESEKEITPLPTGSEHILLVDDEQPIVNLEKQMLERLGYHATIFTSSADALAVFRADPNMFDLVITDMNMPHLNGMQLAEELVAVRPDIPIILCTGFSERINKRKAGTLGIRGQLMKPMGMKDLAEKIREVLDE